MQTDGLGLFGQHMHPILIRFGNYELPSNVVLIAVAGLVAMLYFRFLAKRMGLDSADHYWFLVNAIGLSGFLGGRLLSLLVHPGAFRSSANILEALTSAKEGLATYGVLAGILAGVYFSSHRLKLGFPRLLDHVCLVVPVAHGIARLGCFLTGCCYGRVIDSHLPWAVSFADPTCAVPAALRGTWLHPTQLYEVAGNALLAALLYFVILPSVERRSRPAGSVAATYFAGYGILRLAVDNFRGDPDPLAINGVTLAQSLSLASILCAVVFLCRAGRRPNSSFVNKQPQY